MVFQSRHIAGFDFQATWKYRPMTRSRSTSPLTLTTTCAWHPISSTAKRRHSTLSTFTSKPVSTPAVCPSVLFPHSKTLLTLFQLMKVMKYSCFRELHSTGSRKDENLLQYQLFICHLLKNVLIILSVRSHFAHLSEITLLGRPMYL